VQGEKKDIVKREEGEKFLARSQTKKRGKEENAKTLPKGKGARGGKKWILRRVE